MMLRHWEAVQKNWNRSKSGMGSVSEDSETRSVSLLKKNNKRFSEFLSKKACSCEPSASIHLSFELKQRREKSSSYKLIFNTTVMKALQLKFNASAQQNSLYLEPVKPFQNTVPLFMLPTRATAACSSSSTQNRPRSFAVARKAAPGAGL